MSPLFNHIAIAGLGLIGGSLARDIKQRNLAERVSGYGRNPDRMKKAYSMGLIDAWHVGFDHSLSTADLVVVGTPVCSIAQTIQTMAPYFAKGTLVTDVGSVKGPVVAAVSAVIPNTVCFIGGHPIAGTEHSGFEASCTGLFANRFCVLTPTESTDKGMLEKLTAFWEAVGSHVITMDVTTHDRIFGAISHLPHMVAFSLVNALVDTPEFDRSVLKYSAGGFRDFTRIAASDPVMWRDIVIMNRDNILHWIDIFQQTLAALASAIADQNAEAIEQMFQKSRDARRELL
ncbi:MAG: prephenate dehydrogenase/arogenate dehydrogenase family protein [Desulfobacterota bacterium]|nr:prephenate dehydrogenase/arogenate dehydrogenase family protein [Thermodesulfobacteriota bacterium]